MLANRRINRSSPRTALPWPVLARTSVATASRSSGASLAVPARSATEREDGSMVMEGTVVSATGTTANERITWSVIDGNPDRVRQLWQFSTDGGQTWGVRFDGEYRRRPGSGR